MSANDRDRFRRTLFVRLQRLTGLAISALCLVVTLAPSIAHALTVSPSAVSFPDTAAGSTSAATVTIANEKAQSDSPSFNGLTDSGDFSATNNCSPAGLPPGQSCTFVIVFHPSSSGSKSGTLTILDGSYNRYTVALSGMGIGNGAPVATPNTVTPTSLDFGSVPYQTPAKLSFTYTNNGSSAVTLQPSFADLPQIFAADFDGTCFWNNPVVPAGGSCTYNIEFVPEANQNYSSTFTIVDGVANPTVALLGIGLPPGGGSGALIINPSPIDIKNVPNTESGVVNYTLTNTTSQTMVLVDVQVPLDGTILKGSPFTSGNCHATPNDNPPVTITLAPGASCSDYIEYDPVSDLDQFQGFLVVKYIFQGLNTSITANFPILANAVSHASLGISPNPLQFAATPVGTTSQQTVTVSNSGPALLTFNSATLTSGDAKNFSATNTCGSTLAGNSACTITVTFAPDSSKTEYNAQLVVQTSDPYSNSASTNTIVPLAGGTQAADFVVSSTSGTVYYNTQPDNSQTATWLIKVAPLDPNVPWNQPVTFKITSDLDAANGAPVFTPASLTPGNMTKSTTLTLTKASSAALVQGMAPTGKLPMLAGGVLFLLCWVQRRRMWLRRPMASLILMASTTLSLTSCADAPNPIQIVVTATSGSISHTVTLTLQP